MNLRTRALLSGENIGKMFRSAKSDPFPGVIGTFMGRDALSLAVSLLGLTTADRVLLPAYLCGEVLRPFVGKARVDFYDIRPDLTVDPDAIKTLLETTEAKLLLIINYFGFLQPFRAEIRQLCTERGVVLVEDCAHSLLTTGSGTVGDLCIYSFRKFLLVPDGGGLKINRKGMAVNPDFYPRALSNLLSMGVVLRSMVDFKTNLLSRAWFSSQTASTPATTSAPGNRKKRILPLSTFTHNGMGNMTFADIIEKRRSDYRFWLEMSGRDGAYTPVFGTLPGEVCPLGVPVTCGARNPLRARLEHEGALATVEWRLPSAVGPEFTTAHELSAQMLTLPVYPMFDRTRYERGRAFLAS